MITATHASSWAIAGILVMSAFFRLLACVAPSMVVAQSLGAFTLLILVISSGFAIVRGDIPGWCDHLP
jgi:ABC-type multidrug transport system permease subunit